MYVAGKMEGSVSGGYELAKAGTSVSPAELFIEELTGVGRLGEAVRRSLAEELAIDSELRQRLLLGPEAGEEIAFAQALFGGETGDDGLRGRRLRGRALRKEAAGLVEMVLAEITEKLALGETVKLSSFGSFLVRDKGERVGRNPKTGVEVPIMQRRVIVFKPSNVLKARMNGETVDDEL